MKYPFVIFVIILCNLVHAQNELVDIQREIWLHGAYSDQIPSKWQNESSVIIYQRFYNEYTKIPLSGKLEHINISRRRIKLQDRAAVNEYSFFEYNQTKLSRKGVEYVLQIKLIKPNGFETIIDTSYAENIIKDNKVVGKKLAVPNLAPGDIIDYFEVERTVQKQVRQYFEFPIEYHTLAWERPVMKQEIEFKILKKCRINARSLNGAPEFVVHDENGNHKSYVLIDEMREKREKTKWLNRLSSLPSIKFKVIYAGSEIDIRSANFYAGDGMIKKTVTKSDVLVLIKKYMPVILPMTVSFRMYPAVIKEIENDYIFNSAQEKIVAYFQRGISNARAYFPSSGKSYFNYESNFAFELSVLYHVIYYCRENNLKYKLLLAPSKYRGAIKDIISVEELDILLEVDINGESLFISPKFRIIAPGEIPYYIQGVDAYTVTFKGSTVSGVFETKIPTQKNHCDITNTEVLVDVSKDQLSVVNHTTLNGYLKYIKLKNFDYDLQELNRPIELINMMKKRRGLAVYGSGHSLYFYSQSQITPRVSQEAYASDTYNSEFEDYDYDVTLLGISFDDDTMRFHERFVLGDKLKTLGSENYFLQLKEFLPGQVKIPEYQRKEREEKIEMPVEREFVTHIKIVAPENYKFEGIESLNSSFENEVGKFTGVAKLDDEVLKLSIKKHYKKPNCEASEWQKVIEFTDFAYNYHYKGLVLKHE